MSKKKRLFLFVVIIIASMSGCAHKPKLNIDLSETPKSREELEAEKFADKASYDMSSYFLKRLLRIIPQRETGRKSYRIISGLVIITGLKENMILHLNI